MKKEKKQCIVFLGLKTTGKDYNSQAYINVGFKKIALADPLRDTLWGILGYKPEDYDSFKKSNFGIEKQSILFEKIPYFTTKTICTGRQLLQNTGSVFKQLLGENFWADMWFKTVTDSNCNVVCTDCRFSYEILKAQELKKHGYNVTFVWCQYEGARYEELLADKHESEALCQFIYKNRKEYGLQDGSEIADKTMGKILEDFKRYQKLLK